MFNVYVIHNVPRNSESKKCLVYLCAANRKK